MQAPPRAGERAALQAQTLRAPQLHTGAVQAAPAFGMPFALQKIVAN